MVSMNFPPDMTNLTTQQPENPATMQLSDFENPHDAFFWLGYFSAHNTSQAVAEPPVREDKLCEIAHYCVFDTETSGLSAKDCVIQFAIGFYDQNGSQIGFYDRLWKLPSGTRISQGSFKVHKISMERLNQEGCETSIEIEKIMKYMQEMRGRKKMIIAHNATFDVRMLAQTARSWGKIWCISADDVFCTMKSSKVHCGLTSTKTGRPKAPSNTELYEMLTGEKVATEGLHNALFDISLTSTSFFRGALRGWWAHEIS